MYFKFNFLLQEIIIAIDEIKNPIKKVVEPEKSEITRYTKIIIFNKIFFCKLK